MSLTGAIIRAVLKSQQMSAWDADEIRPRLFLGSFGASEVAYDKGITHVLVGRRLLTGVRCKTPPRRPTC